MKHGWPQKPHGDGVVAAATAAAMPIVATFLSHLSS